MVQAKEDKISAIRQSHRRLSKALIEYSLGYDHKFENDETALNGIVKFIEINKIPIIVTETIAESALGRSGMHPSIARIVAEFIQQKCLQGGELEKDFVDLLEGIIMKDVVLMSDVNGFSKKLKDVIVILDTPIILSAVGLYGDSSQSSTMEALALLRGAGAKTYAFSVTVDEIKRILSAYERKLRSSKGRLELHQTDLTRYVLEHRLTSGDISVISSTIESRIGDAGIIIRGMPPRQSVFTLDEVKLADMLSDPSRPRGVEDPRIAHDVDCIAGILTLRKGIVSDDVSCCIALFVTNSPKVISNSQKWYKSEDKRGTPPIVHQISLTNIAWLRNPQQAGKFHSYEFAGVCNAVLKPSRKTWDKFVANLVKMRDDRHISNDEAVALMVSSFTESALLEVENETGEDSASIEEAVEKVRKAYVEDLERETRERLRRAEDSAKKMAGEHDMRLRNMRYVIGSISNWSLDIFLFFASFILASGTVISAPEVFEQVPAVLVWAARSVVALSLIFGFWSAMMGYSVDYYGNKIYNYLTKLIGGLLYGDDYSKYS